MNVEAKKLKTDPCAHVTAFFGEYTFPEAEVMLWNWLKVTVRGDYQSLDMARQESFARFFDALNDLVKAAHALCPKQADKENLHAL